MWAVRIRSLSHAESTEKESKPRLGGEIAIKIQSDRLIGQFITGKMIDSAKN